MLEPPFIRILSNARSVLLTGAGGGFDIVCGLPIFFALKERGIKVHLASLSFSFNHGDIKGKNIGSNIVEVDAASYGSEYYFPEGYLAKWMCRKRIEQPIYCMRPNTGVIPMRKNYEALHDLLEFDTIVLVDGGVDSILKGDETRIGTPVEDMTSLAAAIQLPVPNKLILALGYGAETDVCNAHALETIAQLIASGAFLGALTLTSDMPEVKRFTEACEFIFYEMRGYESVICSSVMSALEGKFGDHHRTKRTLGSKLHINPLMLFYWCFLADKVAENVLYLDQLRETETRLEVMQIIKKFRDVTALRSPADFLAAK